MVPRPSFPPSSRPGSPSACRRTPQRCGIVTVWLMRLQHAIARRSAPPSVDDVVKDGRPSPPCRAVPPPASSSSPLSSSGPIWRVTWRGRCPRPPLAVSWLVGRSAEAVRDRDAWETVVWRHSLRSNAAATAAAAAFWSLAVDCSRPTRPRLAIVRLTFKRLSTFRFRWCSPKSL